MESQINENENQEFVMPFPENEIGEIERVAQTFGQKSENFQADFLKVAKSTEPVPLSEDIWAQLENTDSYDIQKGDWKTVDYHAVEGNPESPRDWKSIKEEMETKSPIIFPMIVQVDGKFHLVSGNTRLMVARALGIIPKVLIVNMERFF